VYSPGNLIYFTPFYFKGDANPKNKYLLILKILNNNNILVSLPSSQVQIPSQYKKQFGCIENSEDRINCFKIKANSPVTDDGWSFPKDTYLYGYYLEEYNLDMLKSVYKIDTLDYEVQGALSTSIFLSIIECFRNSAIVKRKYKRALSDQDIWMSEIGGRSDLK